MFSAVLVANRGEIAITVVRACREPGMRTGARAIHPGHGLLSEEPDFAEVCEVSGITFIGPPAAVMQQAGLPGSTGAVATPAEAREVAERIGCPLIPKAVAGGGGRGMALMRQPDGLVRAFNETRAHARTVCAAAVGHVGAGTSEFVLSPGHEFHLMEINCRLQVGHPATEMDTGIDILRKQILIAAGQPLSLHQEAEREFIPAPGSSRNSHRPAALSCGWTPWTGPWVSSGSPARGCGPPSAFCGARSRTRISVSHPHHWAYRNDVGREGDAASVHSRGERVIIALISTRRV